MDTKQYDVIIVGAGVSGLMLAKLLNKTKFKVLLVENRDTIKVPWNTRFITPIETIEKFDLDKYVIKKYSTFEFLYLNLEKSIFHYDKNEFGVVDIAPFAQNLELSIDIITSFNITDVKRNKGMVEVTNQSGEIYRTKIIVDCSGESKIISKYLGLIKKGKSIDCYSMSFELANCDISKTESFQFMADLRYVNAGMWFYPYSNTNCQFGNYDFLTEYPDEKGQYDKLFRTMITDEPYKTWFKNSTIAEKVFKIGPAATINVSLANDNFLACGNAAGAGTPIIGEGFRIGLEMAQSAYETINEAFKNSDFSRNQLKMHENNFRNQFGKYYCVSKLIRFVVLHYFTVTEFSLLIRNLSKLSPIEMKEVLKSEIRFHHLWKVFNFNLAAHIFLKATKFYLSGCKPLNKKTL